MKHRTLPLGIDLGETRIRVVHAAITPDGLQIRAVSVRDVCADIDATYLAALVEEAVAELPTRERRCVTALGAPDALLRRVTFPKMTSLERERAARFEARRHTDIPLEEAIVRLHPCNTQKNLWTLGVARKAAVDRKTAILRCAGLKVVSMDHEACAFARALPHFDAIVDLGNRRTSLHVVTGDVPTTFQIFGGGADVTRSIERELAIDYVTAEKRKRILGTAGAGERARTCLVADVAELVRKARQLRPITRIAVLGNGARLQGFASSLEAATGALCEMPVSDTLRTAAYPEDVVRSSAPDWTLAAGIALWRRQ